MEILVAVAQAVVHVNCLESCLIPNFLNKELDAELPLMHPSKYVFVYVRLKVHEKATCVNG